MKLAEATDMHPQTREMSLVKSDKLPIMIETSISVKIVNLVEYYIASEPTLSNY